MADFESVERGLRGLRERKRMGDAFKCAVAHYLRHDPAVAFLEVWLWADWLERMDLALGQPRVTLPPA